MRRLALILGFYMICTTQVIWSAEKTSLTGCPLVSRDQVAAATGGQGHSHWVIKVNDIGVIVVAGSGSLEPESEKIERRLCEVLDQINVALKSNPGGTVC